MNAISVSATVTSGRRQLVNVRQRSLLMAKWRVLWVLVLFAVIALCALLRIVVLGLFEPAHASRTMAEALLPPRGDIVDRNGVPLARAFPAYALWFNPGAMGGGSPLVKSPREVAAALVRIFPDMDAADLTARLASGKPGYLRRRLLPEDANRIHTLGEPALEFPRENERFYPQGSMAAHVLGFVAADGHGRVGMEQVFDEQLTDPLSRGTASMLSLDARVQGALEDELGKGMAESNAKGAAGIVLDADTGEVLALASLPSFNPNLIDTAGSANIFNRFTNQVYELGSTFKPITVAAAIDAGVVTDLSHRYQASRPLKIGNAQIRDSHAFAGSLNIPEALIHSSNVVTAQVADQLGGVRLKQTMQSLGMNERPYIELPAKGFPLWPKGEWSRITTMTVSYGHGIAVTPLHLASAYAAMVNGGVLAAGDAAAAGAGTGSRRPARVQGLDQRADAAAAADDRGGWHRQEGQCPRIPGWRQDRVGGKAWGRRLSQELTGGNLRRCLPDGPPALRRHCHARRAAGHRRHIRPAHRRLERRADRRPGGPPHRPAAGGDARRQPRRRYYGPFASGRQGGSRMKLGALATAAGLKLAGNGDQTVTGFAIDHRKVAPGTVFGAFQGALVNGEDFIPAAISAGAIAIVARPVAKVAGAIHIADPEPRRAFARIAARFFTPVPETIVAVTGTNGKTSTVEMTRQIWRMAGHRAASIGTLGVTTPDESVSTGLTTPDIVTFLANMSGLAREGVSHVAYEASSHGLAQFRNEGLRVAAGAFTNLSRDHLDYHKDMDDYFAAKMRLFDEVVEAGGAAVIWADDAWSDRAKVHAAKRGLRLLTVGEKGEAIRLVSRQPTLLGQTLEIEHGGSTRKVNLPLIGAYQAANVLVAAGLVLAVGGNAAATFDALARLQPVRGRLERAAISRAGAPVYVDYAHTPDALEAAIAALRPHVQGRLIVVFGAGGDRDQGKRPEMGQIAVSNADSVIVTDDNPRGEDPAAIRAMVLAGAAGAQEIGDRREAIAAAIAEAGPDDIVLVAGKGHEQGQIIGSGDKVRVLPFDDVTVARECAA